MSYERAKNKVEQVAGAARARMGDMDQGERSRAERVMKQDEARTGRSGERVQEGTRDARERSFTT
ncbi:hypothetical protein GA0070624_4262 [Micromonospora rhizosphaerae]|uniref:CsbD-like n=1 Tax=Micromonospora rhizosphaerae TaxID=568872 RepID=A0A1C6SQ62_9ACTN|nr:hypothetical protein [Micromonospora rhizosphaerae]SCL31409.1 hypothetical protein GA0070624_4262 [Micromonospora rhizosphaerae]